jgi:hypothetical protein
VKRISSSRLQVFFNVQVFQGHILFCHFLNRVVLASALEYLPIPSDPQECSDDLGKISKVGIWPLLILVFQTLLSCSGLRAFVLPNQLKNTIYNSNLKSVKIIA